ncbi:Protein SRG1 [Acorus calamus]|uniref:Protein SRG1 n=1 Tax=Acorus calamus TaxID=4465 RepID=A0AAV9CS64_ACOCL|nr:Protein SRG1 [Acorus calamus]
MESGSQFPTLPHALIINMGDFMEIMSNGMFKSPVHRAVTNPAKERISVAMFYSLEADKVIEPAEGLVDEKRPRLYEKVTRKGYHDLFWEDFRLGKRTIDQIKVSNTE